MEGAGEMGAGCGEETEDKVPVLEFTIEWGEADCEDSTSYIYTVEWLTKKN